MESIFILVGKAICLAIFGLGLVFTSLITWRLVTEIFKGIKAFKNALFPNKDEEDLDEEED